MERRGIPGVLVVSDVFVPLAEAEARYLGLPALRMIVMPHPIGTRERVELERDHLPEACRQLDAILRNADRG